MQLLLPLSWLYGALWVFWDLSWRFRKPARAPGPVISVGNLTLGGTGKTPITLALARFLLDHAQTPAILTRGYRRKARYPLRIGPDTPVEAAGDEPMLLFRKLGGRVPVVVGKDRVWGAWKAAEAGARVFLLDDGFQYRRLARDLDLVVLLPRHLHRPPALLPAGPLREPFRALQRADFLLVNFKLDPPDPALPTHFRGKPLFPVIYRFVGLRRGRDFLPPEAVRGKRAFAFCGIADPGSFRRALERVGMRVVGFRAFLDHHWYRERELLRLQKRAEKAGAELLVTTEKDAVRLPSRWAEPVWTFEIEVVLPPALLTRVEEIAEGV